MSRVNSAPLIAALSGHSTGDVLLALLTLTHSSFGTKRLVNDTEDLVSGGDTFTAFAFGGTLPQDLDGPATGSFLLDGADPAFVADLLAAGPGVEVLLEAVRLLTPDTIEGTAIFQGKAREYDEEAGTLQLDCAHEPVQDDPFPGFTYDPQRAPDVFVEPE